MTKIRVRTRHDRFYLTELVEMFEELVVRTNGQDWRHPVDCIVQQDEVDVAVAALELFHGGQVTVGRAQHDHTTTYIINSVGRADAGRNQI